MVTTTQLLSNFLEKKEGKIIGNCVLCSKKTKKGLKIKSVISGSFTAFELLQTGDCFCPNCAGCFSTEVRRSNWLVSEKEFKQFKRKEILPILQNLPKDPFMISLTKNYKKYGFLFVANTINYSRENYSIAFEDRILRIKQKQFLEIIELMKKLREVKITKKELTVGEFYPGSITKIIEMGLFEKIKLIKNCCKTDNWILALFLIP